MKANYRFTQACKTLLAGAAAALYFLTFALPVHAQTAAPRYDRVDLVTFIQRVRNGESETLRGVYVPQRLSLPVVQQSEADPGFVSMQPHEVTQFSQPRKIGNIGLLAHNMLAGRLFFNIPEGEQIILVYGDGRTETFIVEQVLAYETLPYGQYRNIETGEVIGIGSLFELAYGGEYHLTLQTCIAQDGNGEWGRLFIIAKPSASIETVVARLLPKRLNKR